MSDSKLLFMSGYLDVEYLKSAIKLSAVDYIEKPIKISEIKTAIAKTVQSVEKSHKLENDLSTKRSLQYQKLTRLLIEGDHEIEEILKFCQEAGYPVNSGYMCLLIVCPTLPESENAFLEEINAFWRGQSAFSIGKISAREDSSLCWSWVKPNRNALRLRRSCCSSPSMRYIWLPAAK